MSETDDTRTGAHTLDPESIPPDKRPGHEQDHDNTPVVETRFEDPAGREWFTVGNSTGVICTRDPVDVEP